MAVDDEMPIVLAEDFGQKKNSGHLSGRKVAAVQGCPLAQRTRRNEMGFHDPIVMQ